MDDSRLERLERRLDELDQRSSSMERAMDGAMRRSRSAMNTVIPDQTRRHMRAAWRENLLAMRSMLDFWADRLSDPSDGSADTGDSTSTGTGNGSRENIRIE
jgi:hypothetical protein